MLPDAVEWDDDFDAAECTLLLGARNEQRCLAIIARHASAMLLAMQRSRSAILACEHALSLAARRAAADAAVDAAVEATATAAAPAPPPPPAEGAAPLLSTEARCNLRNARLVLESELSSCEFFAELAAVTAPLLALPVAQRIERVKAKHMPRLESSAISRFVVATSGALASYGM